MQADEESDISPENSTSASEKDLDNEASGLIGDKGFMDYTKGEVVGSDGLSGWGAPYFEEDTWQPISQVVAAVSMLGPVGATWIVAEANGCDIDYSSMRPVGTGIIAYTVLLPGSIASHLSCAIYRRWVPRCQKADRIGVALSVVLQCWACSQNPIYTVVGALLAVTYIALITCCLSRFQMDADTASLMVGAFVVFGLCSMQIPHNWLDWRFNPYFILAAAPLFAGFAVFIITPVRSWTDTVWHVFLTLYAISTGYWIVKLERDIYGSCSDA